MPFLLLAALGLAHAAPDADPESLRLTLARDALGWSVVGAMPSDEPVLSRPGPVTVRDADGSVLATTALPPLVDHASVLGDDGTAHTAHRPGFLLRVQVPWPEGAATLSVDDRVVPDLDALLDRSVARAVPRLQDGDVVQLLEGGDSANRLDLVLFAEGYTAEREEAFEADADALVDELLRREPYASYAHLLNIWRVFVASDDPGLDRTEPADVEGEVSTPFECYLQCGGIPQLICCDEDRILSTVDAEAPFADGVMLLVDTTIYGGSGGVTYSTAAMGHPDGLQIALHELGHTLIGLWDEYSYGLEGAAEDYISPNCSPDPEAPHWEPWVGETFPYGGGEAEIGAYPVCSFTNWYKPSRNACLMETLFAFDPEQGERVPTEYCPVCREAVVRILYSRLGGELLSTVSPEPGSRLREAKGETIAFDLETPLPPESLVWEWSLDGEILAEDDPDFTLDACSGLNGELQLRVYDPTPWVRADPDALLEQVVTWKARTRKCDGCGCASAAPPTAAWIALAALMGALRRRRPTWPSS